MQCQAAIADFIFSILKKKIEPQKWN